MINGAASVTQRTSDAQTPQTQQWSQTFLIFYLHIKDDPLYSTMSRGPCLFTSWENRAAVASLSLAFSSELVEAEPSWQKVHVPEDCSFTFHLNESVFSNNKKYILIIFEVRSIWQKSNTIEISLQIPSFYHYVNSRVGIFPSVYIKQKHTQNACETNLITSEQSLAFSHCSINICCTHDHIYILICNLFLHLLKILKYLFTFTYRCASFF